MTRGCNENSIKLFSSLLPNIMFEINIYAIEIKSLITNILSVFIPKISYARHAWKIKRIKQSWDKKPKLTTKKIAKKNL